jgi:hypothetical protein
MAWGLWVGLMRLDSSGGVELVLLAWGCHRHLIVHTFLQRTHSKKAVWPSSAPRT